MWHTLQEMSGCGHKITLVSPTSNGDPPTEDDLDHLEKICRVRLVKTKPRGLWTSLVISRLARRPASVVRHFASQVQRAVADELEHNVYDILHAEQVQALQNVPRGIRGLPIVLRCQNVESKLWEMFGNLGRGVSAAARWEARMMRRYEAAALRRATRAIALTQYDQQDLCELSGLPADAIHTVSAPFPAQLPAGENSLQGEPSLVHMDGSWWPIRDSTDWFTTKVWPEVRSELPHAVFHCFGDQQPSNAIEGYVRHPAPSDSAEVFARNAILVVPLRIASGLRMKILESWSRGVPVVATPEAARGLETHDGQNLLLASTPNDFASAVRKIFETVDLKKQLVEEGRDTLRRHHNPQAVTDSLIREYRSVTDPSPVHDATPAIE
jgi:hypothetical protein